ncbi:MAG: sialidase family protein, partial [Acidobacteria bacterium]|nr:sialidase family protein [Acidobacteriota bacterium]
PSGAFLGEQFPAPGLVLSGGRIVLQLWGARARGENWRCGVLLSDDDGLTWRYRDVGYEPDVTIRDKASMPAGFNEQTLFHPAGARLVSIIRGREKLGRVPGSPRDTFYFRSSSDDGGETWSRPEATNMAGTGAPPAGLVLDDGSLLTASRVCYHRDLYPLPDRKLFGLIFFRSRDEGRTWTPEHYLQHDPPGTIFDSHYNAMNGQFLRLGRNRYTYLFPQFDLKRKIQRLLAVDLHTAPA